MATQTILIIDDSPTDRAILRRHLMANSPTAYTIVEAESGVDGWEALDSVKPDCLLLDVNLPDFDGTDFLETLAKQKGVHAPPTIILTGQGSEGLAAQLIRIGAQDYLPKDSLHSDQLHHRIQTAIHRAIHQREEAQHQKIWEHAHTELRHVTSVLATDIKNLSESIVHSTSQHLTSLQNETDSSSSFPLLETQHSAKSMLSLVEELLVFIKLASDPPSAKTEIHLQQLLDNILQELQPSIDDNQATIEADSLPVVLGHSEPLHHLFVHLIQNSLRSSGAEAPQINITARAAGTNWHCSVRDNGKGMPLENLNLLFSAFGQDPNLSENQKAWGLRMALCKRVVDLHQGRIWAESHEDEGTVVHFTIPQQ